VLGLREPTCGFKSKKKNIYIYIFLKTHVWVIAGTSGVGALEYLQNAIKAKMNKVFVVAFVSIHDTCV